MYRLFITGCSLVPSKCDNLVYRHELVEVTPHLERKRTFVATSESLVLMRQSTAYCGHLVGVPNWAETVNSGSVEPDQARTCEGKQE